MSCAATARDDPLHLSSQVLQMFDDVGPVDLVEPVPSHSIASNDAARLEKRQVPRDDRSVLRESIRQRRDIGSPALHQHRKNLNPHRFAQCTEEVCVDQPDKLRCGAVANGVRRLHQEDDMCINLHMSTADSGRHGGLVGAGSVSVHLIGSQTIQAVGLAGASNMSRVSARCQPVRELESRAASTYPEESSVPVLIPLRARQSCAATRCSAARRVLRPRS
jgi:hypothetical protein